MEEQESLRDGTVAIHTALTEPMLTMGMPRLYLILVWTFAVAFGFGAGNWWAWPIGLIFHVLGKVATYYDEQFVEVLVRHIQLRATYE